MVIVAITPNACGVRTRASTIVDIGVTSFANISPKADHLVAEDIWDLRSPGISFIRFYKVNISHTITIGHANK